MRALHFLTVQRQHPAGRARCKMQDASGCSMIPTRTCKPQDERRSQGIEGLVVFAAGIDRVDDPPTHAERVHAGFS